MHILREDEKQLEFIVYPTKYFLLSIVSLILIFVDALFHPDISAINDVSGFLNIHLSTNESVLAGTIITFAIIIYLLIILIVSYLIPIRVVIDKTTNTIIYHYLSYAPIRAVGESTFKITKDISINNLHKLIYTNNIPEIPLTPRHSAPHAIAKYCFMLKDNSSVNVYAGVFSQFPHRYAFMKIAEYLKIPYELDLGKSSDYVVANTHTHLIRVLLFILIALILLLVLFVGAIFLVGFLSQWK